MFKKKKIILIILAVFLAIFVLGACGDKDTSADNVTKAENTEINAEEKKDVSDDEGTVSIKAEHYDESLNGRGQSDGGRSEPNYIDVIGYVAVSSSQKSELERTEEFQNESLWVVPTYEQDKQFWNENGTLPHKTEVVVRNQLLEHKGYGNYSGYLQVEKTDDHSQYYIDVNNFITKPYWNYQDDLLTAARSGAFIAEYNQKSDYYPVTSGGEKVDIPNGTIVLVSGTFSSYESDENNNLEAVVWKEWSKGYGPVKCGFNESDLTIIY